MFDFYTEQHPNMTYHVAGQLVTFRAARFTTNDEVLARELLAQAAELEIIPGEWAQGGRSAAAGEEMAQPKSAWGPQLKRRQR